MYNGSKWFSFFHNNFKMKVNEMPPETHTKKKHTKTPRPMDSTEHSQGWTKKDLWQIKSPKDAMARTRRVIPDIRALRAGYLTCQSEHSQLWKMKVSERKRMKQAFQGQWKLFYISNWAIHVKICVSVCMPKLFFLLSINYICWFQKGNTPNWSCLFFKLCNKISNKMLWHFTNDFRKLLFWYPSFQGSNKNNQCLESTHEAILSSEL